jgi:hypothetical protein
MYTILAFLLLMYRYTLLIKTSADERLIADNQRRRKRWPWNGLIQKFSCQKNIREFCFTHPIPFSEMTTHVSEIGRASLSVQQKLEEILSDYLHIGCRYLKSHKPAPIAEIRALANYI